MSKLGLILRICALGIFILASADFFVWLFHGMVIISPFISLMAIVGSPFFYWMGVMADKEIKP